MTSEIIADDSRKLFTHVGNATSALVLVVCMKHLKPYHCLGTVSSSDTYALPAPAASRPGWSQTIEMRRQ